MEEKLLFIIWWELRKSSFLVTFSSKLSNFLFRNKIDVNDVIIDAKTYVINEYFDHGRIIPIFYTVFKKFSLIWKYDEDYMVSCNSLISIPKFILRTLFTSKKEISFDGFEEKWKYGSFEDNNKEFSVKTSNEENFFTFIKLLHNMDQT